MEDETTPKILRQIRDEIGNTNARLEETNARIDETNARLEETNVRVDRMRDELGRRIVESELRTATAVTDLHGTVRDIRDLLATNLRFEGRVRAVEHDVAELKGRVR